MAWQDRLQKASFRGVEFHVDADDATFGRRTQTHEYPKRDKPYVEDLGRSAREISLTAFLIGADYMELRDSLLAEIERPGSGTLVHPWYGQLTVNVKDDCRVTHSYQDGGVCRIQLSFIESGELSFPAASNATGAKTLQSADTMQAVSVVDFSGGFTVEDFPAWVSDDAISSMTDMLGNLETTLASGVLAFPVADIVDQLPALVLDSATLAERIFGLFNKASSLLDPSGVFADFQSLNFKRVFSAIRAAGLFGKATRPASLTPSRTRLYDNRDAMSALVRRASLVQASGMSALMSLPVYDDAIRVRAELLNALDSESADASDTVYPALMDLRANVYQDITARVRNSARLMNYTPRDVTPAIVLAYDLYENAAREPEIIARNRVRHPGFVPVDPIKVLSE